MLENIKVSDVQRNKQLPQVVVRRNKLIKALHDQLQAASAFVEGKQFFKTMQRTLKNKETGTHSVISIERPVHPWFWEDPWGGVYMQVRYGSKVIKVKDGLPTIVVGERENLVELVQLLKDAVAAGQFDESIQDVQRNYGRPIKKGKGKMNKEVALETISVSAKIS